MKNKHLPHTQTGCVYIHPKTGMDNMQCDFDGDVLAFAPTSQLPILAAEVKHNNLPENRYPDIVKKAKIPYQGTFAQIAISAMENKIGIIANQIQKNIALQCEVCNLPQQQKADYLQKVSAHLRSLLYKHKQGELNIADRIREQVGELIFTQNESVELEDEKIDNKLNQFKKILKECVSELGNELQIATDGPKSALRPDNVILDYTQAITSYKEVEWLKDKKDPEAFINRGMKTNGYSPIDLMIEQTNQIFEENQLSAKARPVEQFRGLYPQVEFTAQQREEAQQIKNRYNSLIRERILSEERQKVSESPYLVITSPNSGKKLEIDNLIKFEIAKNPQFWKLSHLSIKISSRKPSELTSKISSPLFAQAKIRTLSGKEVYLPIGSISEKSIKKHDLKSGMFIENGVVDFYAGVDKNRIDILKEQTKEYIESIRNNTPEGEKIQIAAAIHDVSHTRENQNYSGLKKAGVAFTIFPEVISEQLKQLQFTQMRVIGTQFNEFADQSFSGEKVAIEFEDGVNPRDPTKTARWVRVNGKKLGVIEGRSPHLIAGCKALANIHSPPSKSLIVTSLKNPENKLKIDNVNRYAAASRELQGEEAKIILNVRQTDPLRPATVFVLSEDKKILGILNKQSVAFLEQFAPGRLEGLNITGSINNAPATYADIIIDPSSIEFLNVKAEKQQDSIQRKSSVNTVLFFTAPLSKEYRAKTEQVMSNMLKRAVKRGVENGYDIVKFIDISPNSNTSPPGIRTLEQLAEERKDIKVEFELNKTNFQTAIEQIKQPNDIVIGISNPTTNHLIKYAVEEGKAVAMYIPETEKFHSYNLNPIKSRINISDVGIER